MKTTNKTVDCFAGRPTAKQSTFKANFNTIIQGRFNKSFLPMTIKVLDLLGIKKTGKANRGGYWVLKCPFHNHGKESHPSLNLHQVTGHYRCHACGKKGGDILDFYMEMTSKNFKEAAIELGAWEEGYE